MHTYCYNILYIVTKLSLFPLLLSINPYDDIKNTVLNKNRVLFSFTYTYLRN